jgi:hypothetical protein
LTLIAVPKEQKMARADLSAEHSTERAMTGVRERKPYEPPTLVDRGGLSALVASTTVTVVPQAPA